MIRAFMVYVLCVDYGKDLQLPGLGLVLGRLALVVLGHVYELRRLQILHPVVKL